MFAQLKRDSQRESKFCPSDKLFRQKSYVDNPQKCLTNDELCFRLPQCILNTIMFVS